MFDDPHGIETLKGFDTSNTPEALDTPQRSQRP